MKKILIQLDSDKFPSTFDAIVAYDADVDVVQSYGSVTPADVRGLILGAFFTRGISDLDNLAVWIGGSDVDLGEQMLDEARRTFFGPFKISLMLDSNGCNTTACTAIAKVAHKTELSGKPALVIGPGPVGQRAAVLLAREGCRVHLVSIPADLLGSRFNRVLAQRTLESGLKAAERLREISPGELGGSLNVQDVADMAGLRLLLNQAEIVVTAGPAGLRILPQNLWSAAPKLKWLLDFNLTEPMGIEGIKPSDDFAEYDGKRVLGALSIGNPKMRVHKACVMRLFETNEHILDTEGVYTIAKQFV